MLDETVNFVKGHFSDILSFIGVALTVYYSAGAKKAATAAQEASTSTRTRLRGIEAAGIIRECLLQAEGLVAKVDAEQWESISEKSSLIRKNLVSLKHTGCGVLDAAALEMIEDLIVQFRIITEQSDKYRHGSVKVIKKSSMLTSLHSQIDSLVAIHEKAKNKLGDQA